MQGVLSAVLHYADDGGLLWSLKRAQLNPEYGVLNLRYVCLNLDKDSQILSSIKSYKHKFKRSSSSNLKMENVAWPNG